MNAIEKHAIAKAIASKDLKKDRPALNKGEYPVDLMVRVNGLLKVAEDSDRKATSNILNQEFLALALHYCGATRESALAAIQATANLVMQDYLGDAKASKQQRQEILAGFDPDNRLGEALADAVDQLPRIPKAGAVSFNGIVEKID